MTAPANRWKLGLFVLAGGAVGLVGLTLLGVQQLKRATHQVWAYFDEALTGLDEGSPVRFRGVQIGVVKEIKVAEDKKHLAVIASLYDERLVELGLDVGALDGDQPMPTNLRAQVVMSWVTATAFIQVDFFPDPAQGPQQLPFPVPVHTVLTVPSTAKSLEEAGREVFRELPAIAGAARELIDTMRTELAAMHLPALAQRIDRVLTAAEHELEQLKQANTVASATAALEAVRGAATAFGDEHGPFNTALREVQAVAAELRGELARAELAATSRALRGAADRTGEAAAGVDELREEIARELVSLRLALQAVQRLATLLENDPGSLLHGRGAPPRSPLGDTKR
jgi:ABC-type transporter Mla subunit MlaD